MSILTEIPITNLCFDVHSVSQRASTKLVHQKISINGQSGKNGSRGSDGASGTPGKDGSIGGHGGRGGTGEGGSAGEVSQSGTDSQHAIVQLNGTVENLNMQLKMCDILHDSAREVFDINPNLTHCLNDVNYNFQLTKSKGIILVQTVGGHGGNGGVGGKGGDGGPGGKGGDGCDGRDGSKSYNQGATGKRGGAGRAGGNGGCGGNGGNGGTGGNGGNAGAGGHVQIRSADPQLFMLIELDCRAGIKGKGGLGGKCGSYGIGGRGGNGGHGGSGGRGGPGGSDGADGAEGPPGKCGSYGCTGTNGPTGNVGCAASDGHIEYAVVDEDDKVIEIDPDKYHASVLGYTITDENNDEIYEPDSDFFITNVKWTNNGAMTLPGGSTLSFPSTKYISSDITDVSTLMNANINQILIDSHRFKCHLNAVPTVSINQPYIQPVKIVSEINLLGRLFTHSQVPTTFTCQYPIQIRNIQITTFLGPNERAIIVLDFANISTRPYGTCTGSAGSIEFIFYAHSLIKILPATTEHSYCITPNGHGRYKINENLSPKSTKTICFEFCLTADASYQLYENLFWNVDLLLRDTLIENHTGYIRIVPEFNPNIKTDVLLVTNSQTNRVEYLAYQKLFHLFKYSSQMWDIERYQTFHHPTIQWLATANLIIFIYLNPKSTFNVIKSQLFLRHMNSNENAGFICIGNCVPNDFDFALFDYNNLQFIDNKHKTKSEFSNHLWSGFGCKQPDKEILNAMANELRTDYEKRDDHKFLYQIVYDDTTDVCSQHCMTVVYGKKYVYKSTLDFQVGNRLILINSESPLLAISYLPFKVQTRLNRNQLDELISSHEYEIGINEIDNTAQIEESIIQDKIHLDSQLTRLLCAILFYQGFEKSLMMISEKSRLAKCIFALDSLEFSFDKILVSLAMSIIERECDRGSLEFHSSKLIVNQAANVIGKANQTSRIKNHRGDQHNWLHLLIQSLDEYIDSKFGMSFPWYGCTNKAKQRNKLQDILSNLTSLTTNKVPKNKELYHAIQNMRLQKLAKLQFPAADARKDCVRKITEIRKWKEEQRT